ncbi:SMC-Scp complex subunit ScpB [Actinophytocola xanthii]|uniref:SMC-Scp complex subunit ScpB n=1 Tax=Actinophytocola xanthii TaxID=1912961 RepID=A0A1Q8CBY2_9PSEU|nr:SMC-Scp complex subunit ScpB [Actinophytocola xanthii]
MPGTDLVEPGEDAAVESDVPATESDLAPADADPPTEVVGEAPDTVSEPADPAADQAEGAEEELPELTDEELENTLEALLLVVDSPVEEEALAGATDTTVARVRETVLRMAAEYAERGRGLDLRHAGGGWRFYTRDRYAPYVEKLLLGGQRAKLTRAALETLAVIAYRQPVTRARVAAVRGVNCDGVIRTLLARGLVEETGTDTETGGFLYRTTELFLERLGLSSLDDLPPIAPLLPEVDSIDDV